MKIVLHHAFHLTHRAASPRRRQQGTAMIVVLALLAIVLIYVGDNLKTLHHLSRELKLVERHQTRRLEALSRTNFVEKLELRTSNSETNPNGQKPSQ